MGSFLIALGVVLFALLIMMWGAVKRSLSKCLYKIVVYTLATLVLVLIVSLILSFTFVKKIFSLTAHKVLSTGTSISADHCNPVTYYWAFVEIGIILLIVVIAILFGFFALIHMIVKCLK